MEKNDHKTKTKQLYDKTDNNLAIEILKNVNNETLVQLRNKTSI